MSVSAKPPGPAGPEGRVCHGTRRDGILEAARAVVPRNGFEHTSIAAIAGRAGFARAAVHQHFCDIDRDESRAGRTKTLAAEIGALVFFAFTHRTLLARGPPPWGLGERGGLDHSEESVDRGIWPGRSRHFGPTRPVRRLAFGKPATDRKQQQLQACS